MAESMGKMPFGKYRGRDVEDVPSGYLKWCLEQEWFVEGEFVGEYVGLAKAVETEYEYRENWSKHFYD